VKGIVSNKCFRAKSTKTRIETIYVWYSTIITNFVLEQNPPKQGLKRKSSYSFLSALRGVLEQNPPKQGLKQSPQFCPYYSCKVLEQNPPKQGLKQINKANCFLFPNGFRAKSIKTRIETTKNLNTSNMQPILFKSKIHQNKD